MGWADEIGGCYYCRRWNRDVRWDSGPSVWRCVDEKNCGEHRAWSGWPYTKGTP